MEGPPPSSQLDRTVLTPSRDAKADLPYEELGLYRLQRLLGQGGMGRVFLARHKTMNRACALKLLPKDLLGEESFVQRFRAEAQVLANLNHPGIVAVHNFDSAQGEFFLEMEYVDGGDLQRRLQNHGALPPGETKRILEQILEAIGYAHGKTIIHRDLKPANILLRTDGTVKISDFGLAAVVGDEFQRSFLLKSAPRLSPTPAGTATDPLSNGIAGTLLYMSPQAMRGEKPSPQDDLYALGVIAYFMLTGKMPNVNFRPPSRLVRGLSRRWDRFIEHCLEEDLSARFPSAEAALAELRRIDRPLLPAWLWASTGLAAAGAAVVLGLQLRTRPAGPADAPTDHPAGLPTAAASSSAVGVTPPPVASTAPLTVRSNLELCQLSVVDTVTGETHFQGNLRPPQTLSVPVRPNPLRLTFRREGYQEETALHVATGGPAEIEVVLERILEERRFTLASQPAGMSVLVEGVDRGVTPATVALSFSRASKFEPWSEALVTLTHPDYYDKELRIGLDQPVALPVAEMVPRRGNFTLSLPGGMKMTFTRIPPGEFLAGSPEGEVGRRADETLTRMEIAEPYFMGVTEVTQEQYLALVGQNPSYHRFQSAKRPVEQIRLEDLIGPRGFLERMNAHLRESGYHDLRALLPTEVQWEYACRAGTRTAFASGRDLSDPSGRLDGLPEWAVYAQDQTAPVASKRANEWGLHDMHGNVWEWTAEGVLRGGSFQEGATSCRSAARWREPKSQGSGDKRWGFRLILVRQNNR